MSRPVVYLHVGAPKTGTTFLQAVAFANQRALRRDGLLYPHNPRTHFLASQDLRDWKFHGYEDPKMRGSWSRMVEAARGANDRVLISHESFGSANGSHVERAMADLDFAEVHIVFTARDMARQLPAAWQERVRNRGVTTFTGFLGEIRTRPLNGPAKRFWALHGVPNILAMWSKGLPPEHVHVVTVPPSGSDPLLLWRRFAQVLRVDPDAYDTTVKGGANSSLGAAEIEVLRRFNETIRDSDIPWPVYAEAFKRGLAPRMGKRASGSDERIELPQEAYDWAVGWAHDEIGSLQEAGYDVVGDLADLVPVSRPTGLEPDHVPAERLTEVAIATMGTLVDVLGRREAGARKRSSAPDSDAAGARTIEVPDVVRRGVRRLRRG